jgi:SulP family sulfate permease
LQRALGSLSAKVWGFRTSVESYAFMNGRQLVLDVSVGLLSGAMRVLGAVSIATLLFPEKHAAFFLTGVSIAVVTVIAANLIGGLRNRIPYVTYSTDYPPIFLFSVVGAAVFTRVPAAQFTATIVLFIMASSITTGIVFWLVGHFRLSNLARFVPFPVVAGFMAGIGLDIVVQSMGNLAGISLDWTSVDRLFTSVAIAHWIPGVVFALVMMFGGRIIRTKFFPQIVIVLTVVIFLAVLAYTNTPISEAYRNGWSAKPVTGNVHFELFLASVWKVGAIQPLLTAAHVEIFFTIIGVSLLSILITLTGLEVSAGEDMDFELELETAGLVNIASGLLGGAVSYQSISTSMMNYKMGGRSRLVPLLTAAVALVFLVFGWGDSAIEYFPKALLSGLVLYVGADFIQTWLLESRKQLTSIEYGLLVTIALTVLIWGVLVGVAVGFAIAMLLFTVEYSQLRCIELRQTGKSLRSNVERPVTEDEIIDRHHDEVRLFRLHGYLFFGSAQKIGEAIQKAIKEPRLDSGTPLHLILDFTSVAGIDSSASMTFAKIFQFAKSRGVKIMLIHLNEDIAAHFRRSIKSDILASAEIYPDRDSALEAREAFILDAAYQHSVPTYTGSRTLLRFDLDEADVNELMTFFKQHDVGAAEVLFKEGDQSDSMIIVDSGEFEVYRETAGKAVRLKKVLPGAVLGEMGIYLGHRRTASVRAITEGRVMVLDQQGLTRIYAERPTLAFKFSRLTIGVLSNRLTQSNNEIVELSAPIVQ